MFQMRYNQLKRQLTEYTATITDGSIKAIAENVMNEIIGTDPKGMLQWVYDHLNQINILGQIFTRQMSSISTHEVSMESFYQITVLSICGELLVAHLAGLPISEINPTQNGIVIKEEKLKSIQDQIRAIKKEKNTTLNTLEAILTNITDNSKSTFDIIKNCESWESLLGHVFGTDVKDEQRGAKTTEHINIIESILSANLHGSLISSISSKYDALLRYTMSLLTMITGTTYTEEFSGQLSTILDSLGSSTKIVLFQQRIKKNLARYSEIQIELQQIQSDITKRIVINSIPVSKENFKSFFETILKSVPFDCTNVEIPQISTYEYYSSIFQQNQLMRFREQLGDTWAGFQSNMKEIQSTLHDIDEFLDSIIKNANLITAKLFSKGFQAALPLHDIQACESVNLHIKNITATSSTKKTNISDEVYDMKLQLLRKFDTDWAQLKNILHRRSDEEIHISNTLSNGNSKLFSEIIKTFEDLISEWQTSKIMDGYPEETYLNSRILYSFSQIIQEFLQILLPLNKTIYNNENFIQYKELFPMITSKFKRFQQFSQVITIFSTFSKSLGTINRKAVVKIGEDPQFFSDPTKMGELINDIPMILKREFMQKLIPLEDRNTKMDTFTELTNLLEKIKNIPPEERLYLIPYNEIQIKN